MVIDSTTIQVLIQGGAVGLALASLGLVAYTIRIMTNHLTDVAMNNGLIAGQMERIAHVIDAIYQEVTKNGNET